MVKNFFKLEIRNLLNSIKFVSWANAFKTSFLMLVGFIFIWLLYQAFFRLLVYLNTIEYIGSLLIVKLMAMIMLTFFAMLTFSNLIISFSTIFFANDLNFLMAMPLKSREIFIYKFIKTTIYSSWMVLLVFLPFLLAYGRIKLASADFYIVTIVLLIPFFLIASSIGTAISTIFMRLFPSQKTRDIFVIFGVIVIGVFYLFARFVQPEDFLKADKLNEVVQYISVVQAPTAKYLPSWWLTFATFSYVSRQWANFFLYTALIISIAFVSILVAILISEKSYYISWVFSREATGYRLLPEIKLKCKGIYSVFIKDIKIFFRDTSQWSQLLLLLALVIVYLFNIYKLPLNTFFLKSLISFLNIGLVGFVLAALSLRLIYPLVSLEGRSFWIIKSAPVKISKFLLEKFLMAMLPLVFFAGMLIGISNYLLNVESFLNYLSIFTIIFIAITLTGMAIGFGAIFPKFRVENISQIESSAGGMIFMIFSLFYVFLVISLEAIPVRLWFLSRFKGRTHVDWGIMGLITLMLIIINTLAVLVPMYLGKRNLEAIDA
ncbi:MAG: hypothetical protein JW983_02495 [Elusimicrobia bacterium]|nr:hypothetical protein [Elusimicrobiota bacterium]